MPATPLVSTLTTNRILHTMWREPGLSRQEITKTLGIDKSTSSKLVGGLIQAGILMEGPTGIAGPEGGRRPVSLGFSPHFGGVLGVSVLRTSIRWVFRSASGSHEAQGQETIPWSWTRAKKHQSPRNADLGSFEDLLDFCRNLVDTLQARGNKVLALALGIPGLVNSDDSILLHSNPLEVHTAIRFPPRIDIGGGKSIPIYLENDSRCCAWDLMGLRGNPQADTLCVLGETQYITPGLDQDNYAPHLGVGCSFIIGGKVHTGRDFSAGEFASPSTGRIAGSQFPPFKPQTNQPLGDFVSSQAYRAFIFEDLARNLAFLFTVLNLGHLVLYGDCTQYSHEFLPLIEGEIRSSWLYENQGTLSIAVGERPFWAVADGAAALVLNRMYPANPVGTNMGVHPLLGIELIEVLGMQGL